MMNKGKLTTAAHCSRVVIFSLVSVLFAVLELQTCWKTCFKMTPARTTNAADGVVTCVLDVQGSLARVISHGKAKYIMVQSVGVGLRYMGDFTASSLFWTVNIWRRCRAWLRSYSQMTKQCKSKWKRRGLSHSYRTERAQTIFSGETSNIKMKKRRGRLTSAAQCFLSSVMFGCCGASVITYVIRLHACACDMPGKLLTGGESPIHTCYDLNDPPREVI
jgi:hypothetical protein